MDAAGLAAPKPEPKRTPLYAAHQKLGARIIDFGGWAMPVNYPGGILAEHHATRKAAGLFDVSHMGEVHFRGPRAAEVLARIITNDLGKLYDGKALYTVMCHDDGGIVDDLIVYRVRDDHFLAIVNASNIDKDFAWFTEQNRGDCSLENASDATALLALQGPRAIEVLSGLTTADLRSCKPFHFLQDVTLAGRAAWIARTGYTGEDGAEIILRNEDAPAVWDALCTAIVPLGGGPVGLGARDTLRLEARLSLYGNDLDDTTSPLEAGLGWVVKLDGADFVGKAALLRQKQQGVARSLCGFVMHGRGTARHDYPIHAAQSGEPEPKAGAVIGRVTSGSPGPTVGKNIGLGYVPPAHAVPGARFLVDCRGRMAEAEVVKGPFYIRPSR